MNEPVATANSADTWIIVVDDTCPVVQKLSWMIKQWDRRGTFRFIGQDNADIESADLIERLSETPWSLMLLDQQGKYWLGPEAIPFILKNLPSGRIAAVTYTVPGTMWVTRKLYHLVSRNRRMFSKRQSQSKEYKTA